MLRERKLARDYLEAASLKDFWSVVKDAKISDDSQKILDYRFVHGWSIVRIAMETNYSQEHIKSVIKQSYDKVANLLNQGLED